MTARGKLFVTADVHYYATDPDVAGAMFAEINGRATAEDVLLVLGDLGSAPIGAEQACLLGFDHMQEFPGTRLFVSGNHDLGVDPDRPSPQASATAARYWDWLPEQAARRQIHALDHEPLTVQGVTFVGTIGPVGPWVSCVDPRSGDRWFREFFDLPDREAFDEANAERLEGWLAAAAPPVVLGCHVPPRLGDARSVFWPSVERHLPKLSRIYCGHAHTASDIPLPGPGPEAIRFVGADYHIPRYLEHALPLAAPDELQT